MARRTLAEGAHAFRRLGWLERLADKARARVGPRLRRPLRALYLACLRVQTRGRGLACRLPGGETVRVLPEYARLSWNPDEYHAFRGAVRDGSIALDVGANAGAYALLLGQWVGPTGRVFAFEPSPSVFETLRRHVALNHLDAVVTPVAEAVGDQVGTAALVIAGTAGESHLILNDRRHDDVTIDVSMTTVDAFCARMRLAPDFIKVDVEGAELAVLRGARQTIAARGSRLALFVEMHPSIWAAAGISADAVLAGIRDLGLEPDRPWAEIVRVDGLSVRLRASSH